jgi:hypothetical protein
MSRMGNRMDVRCCWNNQLDVLDNDRISPYHVSDHYINLCKN